MAQQMWTCPECGNHFVTTHAWHSCGRYTLAQLFASSDPVALELAQLYTLVLEGLGDVEVIPQRSRLTALARVRFAGAVPRKRGLVATFALRDQLVHERIIKAEQHAPAWWTHHVRVTSPADLDAQLRGWLQRSHDTVGTSDGRA